MKVLVAEKICQDGVKLLRDCGLEVDYCPTITREDLLSTIDQYDGLIVRSIPIVDEELLNAATNLKVVGRAGNGVDNINMSLATQKGVIVVNTPDANSVSACELTIGHIIASARNLPQANAHLKSGQWGRSRFQGTELQGKKLGIIGLGRIGTLVATRMSSFGMKIYAYDPYITDKQFQKAGAEKVDTLEDLMRLADILTIHTPRTKETMNMVRKEHFQMAKRGLRVVNCARGGLINEEDLAWALEEGIVASAGFDVLSKEPCTDSPLYKFDNFIVTPHIGATTDEAQEAVGMSVAQEVVSALNGEMVPNAVNLPMVKGQDWVALQPCLNLAETLGKLFYQLEKDVVERVEVQYLGNATKWESDLVTLAVIKGLFEPILMEQINYVNAKLVAESRGVAIAESKESECSYYSNLLRVKVFAGGKEYEYAGTITELGEIHIVNINGFRIDFKPSHYMVVAENLNAPGQIGKMGTCLGRNKVNIGNMQVSPSDGQKAMMVLTVDSPLDEQVLQDMSSLEGFFRVRFVQL